MVELAAKTPCHGLVPVRVGPFLLEELHLGETNWIAPASGAERRLSRELHTRFGFGFPKPGRTVARGGVRCIWHGPGQALLVGGHAGELADAVQVDQSDGWAGLRLSGHDCDQVLARLVPIDLRPAVFKRGHTARTLLNHMPCSIVRSGVHHLDILVFRSMAGSAVAEIAEKMRSVAAQL